MDFYKDPESVKTYLGMCSDYDGTKIHNRLDPYLKEGGTLLELGMGPGHDLTLFNKRYKVTGSDYSEEFLKLYRRKFPTAKLAILDALTIETTDTFDCIFSNKVFQHFSLEQIEQSLTRQNEILNDDGIVAHCFWIGEKQPFVHSSGLVSYYYHTKKFENLFEKLFNILDAWLYNEFEDNDSLMMIARKC